jgi:DNA polymerase III epsilon subunit family exonuclease
MNFIETEEFKKLESEYPLLRYAREHFMGLRGLSCVIVDIETTGLEPETNEIIEVAGLKIVKGQIEAPFNALIKLDRPLPEEIVRLTGLTDEILKGGEQKNFVLQRFVDFTQDLPLVAHNTDFDIPFLQHHLSKTVGKSLPNQALCTLKLSRHLLPGLPSHKLGKVAEHFKIPTPLTHRALGDAEITFQVWLKLAEQLDREGISSLESLLKSGKMT